MTRTTPAWQLLLAFALSLSTLCVLIGWLHDLGHDSAREKHLERLAVEAGD